MPLGAARHKGETAVFVLLPIPFGGEPDEALEALLPPPQFLVRILQVLQIFRCAHSALLHERRRLSAKHLRWPIHCARFSARRGTQALLCWRSPKTSVRAAGRARRYCGGIRGAAPSSIAACQAQRGSQRKPRASATMSALPSATILCACSASVIRPIAMATM